MKRENKNVIYTVQANCQDCYRCVRVCPVKAISVINGQAYVEDKLCIQCGTCVRECPQGAKTIRTDLEYVKGLLKSGQKVAVSVSPSFAAVFPLEDCDKLPSALKKLGFSYVSETVEGAAYVTEKSFEEGQKGVLCSTCPTVVTYVEKYKPEHIDTMIPIVSPMIVHGRLLKKRLGQDYKVVFVGPCAAKKEEAAREENKDAIDGVLTFIELKNWMEEEGIILSECEESEFSTLGLIDEARLFPIQGGMLKAGNIECDETTLDILHLSGAKNVMDILDLPPDQWSYNIVEPLFCESGCINGPGFPKEENLFIRKQNIISYAKEAALRDKHVKQAEVDHTAVFKAKVDSRNIEEIPEKLIQTILENTGKSNPEMQLNCGACGYKSCRDHAIGVAKGMAETKMCVSYMRRLAHQRADRILETTPNGVVMLDKDLNILSMNPAFKKMFMCGENIIGRNISYLLDSENYEKLLEGKQDQYEAVRTKYGIKYHEKTYALREEGQHAGTYSDLTKFKFDAKQIELIKNQTLEQARELLTHQIEFSQQMANFLGKSTAQSEEMVKRIIDLYDEESQAARERAFDKKD